MSDQVLGVPYRSGPKAWMDSRVYGDWLRRNREIGKLPQGRKRFLYVYNVVSHVINEETKAALKRINTEIRFFPPNGTDSVQPSDSFIIQKKNMSGARSYMRRR